MFKATNFLTIVALFCFPTVAFSFDTTSSTEVQTTTDVTLSAVAESAETFTGEAANTHRVETSENTAVEEIISVYVVGQGIVLTN